MLLCESSEIEIASDQQEFIGPSIGIGSLRVVSSALAAEVQRLSAREEVWTLYRSRVSSRKL